MQNLVSASEQIAPRVLQPRRGWVGFGFRELWAYRELLYFMTSKAIKVRYKQTVLGATWAVIQPVVLMLGFTILFGRIAVIPTNGVPRPVFYYAALIPWTYFSHSVNASTNSIVQNGKTISQVYYPRSILPISSSLQGLFDLAISFLLLVALMLYYGLTPSPAMLLLPGLIVLTAVTGIAVGLLLAPLNALYRDIRYGVQFLVQVWMFVSPVIYPSTRVPEAWRPLYYLNPMAGVVDGFRWAVAGQAAPPTGPLLASVGVALTAFLAGMWFFRRSEGSVVDLL